MQDPEKGQPSYYYSLIEVDDTKYLNTLPYLTLPYLTYLSWEIGEVRERGKRGLKTRPSLIVDR